jgi:hypothetical protein
LGRLDVFHVINLRLGISQSKQIFTRGGHLEPPSFVPINQGEPKLRSGPVTTFVVFIRPPSR